MPNLDSFLDPCDSCNLIVLPQVKDDIIDRLPVSHPARIQREIDRWVQRAWWSWRERRA